MELKRRTIIVTGVSSGIGAAIATDLQRRGAAVVGIDVVPSDHVEHFHRADLSDPAQIDELIRDLPDRANGLCNVAGVPPSAPPDRVLGLNAKGLQRLTEGLIPKLADGASIVNIASSAGSGWARSVEMLRHFDDVAFNPEALARFAGDHDLMEEGASYFFSKEFVIVWTMRNRWTWRERGIRMNSVSPGPVDTPALPDFIETLGRARRVMELMDRPARPEEIAPVVAFLLSDESGWIRGSNIAVDGGLTSHLVLEQLGLSW